VRCYPLWRFALGEGAIRRERGVGSWGGGGGVRRGCLSISGGGARVIVKERFGAGVLFNMLSWVRCGGGGGVAEVW
jgi:hypothetical protein